jgi:murein DD-endopeptidase MepM/ murein hydrolase activator NlpD
MTTPWWQTPITQAHGQNGEQGVDFGTPFHTPITAILPGTVQRVDCAVPWRCEIDIATTYQGQRFTESFLHIDQPSVSVGQQVSGGSLLGLSGGQLSGGSNPDSPNVSTGPHIEFDMFRGAAPWSGAIDPTALARGGPQGGGPGICDVPVVGGIVCLPVQAGVQTTQAAGDVASGLGSLAQALNPATALQSLSGAVTGKSNIHDFLLRGALVIGGIVLLGMAIFALIQSQPAVQEGEGRFVGAATKAAAES